MDLFSSQDKSGLGGVYMNLRFEDDLSLQVPDGWFERHEEAVAIAWEKGTTMKMTLRYGLPISVVLGFLKKIQNTLL